VSSRFVTSSRALHLTFYPKIISTSSVFKANLRERDHSVDPGVDGRIILRWNFRWWDVWVWTGSSWVRIGTGCGHL